METKMFTVTVEGLKRATVEVEAETQEEAKQKVEKMLMEDGVTGIEFDDMFDSIQVTHARPLE